MPAHTEHNHLSFVCRDTVYRQQYVHVHLCVSDRYNDHDLL